MFYDISVMNGNKIGAVWRAGTDQEMDTSDISLPKACSYLCKRVENYENRGRQNFSLRTSSVLLNGAVRVYKELLNNLYNDCVLLDEEIILRGSRTISSHEAISPDDSSEATYPKVSENKSKRTNCFVQEANTSKRCRRSQNSALVSQSFASSITDKSTNNMSKSAVTNSDSVVREPDNDQCDKGVETTQSFIQNFKLKEEYRRQNVNFERAPVALIMVYDNDSRLPKKVIFSNVNKDIRKL